MGAPCAATWFASAVAGLDEEPPAAEPGSVAIVAWFDQVVARLLDEGHVERVTVPASTALPGRDGPIEVTPSSPVLAVDEGGRAYLVRAR